MTAARFFIQRSGRIKGPLDPKTLQSLMAARKIKKSDRFAFSRNGPWSDLATFQEQLAEHSQGSATDPQAPDWDLLDDDAADLHVRLRVDVPAAETRTGNRSANRC